MKRLFILLLIPFTTVVHAADTRYIHDQLQAYLRTGGGNEFRIVRGVPSGTRLTLLERDGNGWARVRTSDGLEAWIEEQVLTEQPVAREQLVRANRELNRLREANRELGANLSSLRAEGASTADSLQELQTENRRLQTELDEIRRISGDALRMERENRELRESSQMLRNQAELLQNENLRLQNSRENEAFLNGAIAVVIGVLIALVVPRLRPRKKSEWA